MFLNTYKIESYQYATGFIVNPYAIAHWRQGDRIIATIEAIPILGFLISLIERVCVFILKALSNFSQKEVIIRGTISQFTEKDSSGERIGISACSFIAVAAINTFREIVAKDEPIKADDIDKAIRLGIRKKIEAGFDVSSHQAVSETLPSFPTLTIDFSNLSLIQIQSILNYKEILKSIMTSSTSDVVTFTITKPPESYAIMINKKTGKFYFFDSHGKPEDAEKKGYVQIFNSLDSLVAFLRKKHPYIEYAGKDNPINTFQLFPIV